MKTTTTLLLFFLSLFAQAQFIQQWQTTYNGDGDFSDHFTCMVEGENGNIYAAGYTQKTDDNADFLVAKFNSQGQQVWTHSWRGNGQGPDIAYGIVFNNNTIFATGEVSNAGVGFDFFTIAISTSGDSLWGAHYNDPTYNQYDQANAICVDFDGNVILAGESDRDPSSIINDDFLVIKYSPTGTLLWTQRYNHTGNATDRAIAVACDGQNNVVVAGRANNGGDDDYAVLQYSASGTLNWSQFFDNGDIDRAADMGIDANNNIYVTGRSNNGNDDDFRTLKYSSGGVQLFNVAYDFVEDDRADFMDVNPDGSFVITGRSDGSAAAIVNYNYRTVKYSSDGAQQWTATYEGTGTNDDIVQDIDLSPNGEVLITGYSDASATALIQNNIVSIKYSSTGSALWTNIYNGTATRDDEAGACILDAQGNARVAGHTENAQSQRDAILLTYDSSGSTTNTAIWTGEGDNSDNAREIARDNNGNLFVAGYSVGKDTDRDMFLMKLNVSGDTLWTRSVSGTLFGSDEEANAIALDNAGNIIISGYTKNSGTGSDITILKYNTGGTLLWTAQYNGNANESDRSYDLTTDASGNIYVTGKTDINASPIITNDELFTAKYSSNGALLWSNVYNGGSGNQRGRFIQVGNSGNVYVCGQSANGTDEDVLVIKYSASGTILWSYTYDTGNSETFESSVLSGDESLSALCTSSIDPITGEESSIKLFQVTSGGTLAWEQTYTASNNLQSVGEAIELSPNGNIVIVGSILDYAMPESHDCLTVCYSSAGTYVWENIYDSSTQLDDVGDALAIDANNNVMVACHSNVYDATNIKFVTTLRSLSGSGELINTGTLDASDTLSVCNDLLVVNNQLMLAGSRWSADGARDMIAAQYDIQLFTEEFKTPDIISFPNPASTELNFHCPSSMLGCNYRVYDSSGKMIFSDKISSELTRMNTTEWAPGNYTISIQTELNTTNSTFIKN
jgi:uncharacterized delta-60 repeat protein